MANETTTTSVTSQILTEVLSPVAIPAHLPKFVVSQLINTDSIDGEPSLTKQYPVYSDLGAASTASEGTDISTNTEMTMGSAVTVTPTEGAAVKATITTRSARRRFPGMSGDPLYDALRSGNLAQVASLLSDHARRLAGMVMEKVEDDVCNLLSGFSNTVGTSGSDFTVANAFSAIYTLKTLEPLHENWAFVLTPNQLDELQRDLGVSGGGVGGSVWTSQADGGFFNHNPDAPRNGFRGTFRNIPIYEYSHSLRTTANSGDDVAGALMCVGQGSPSDFGAQIGPIVMVEGEPMRFDLDYDASLRAGELLAIHEYAVAELDDTQAVSILTDAP